MRQINIVQNTKTVKALNAQNEITQHGFSFTLNPTMGCPYECKYCYSRISLWKTPKEFFETVEIKVNLPGILDKELTKLSSLPQHLKRVQINETCDVYHPTVFCYMRKNNIDVMFEILKIFQKHWDAGNKWMLHILTKSHMILQHMDILKEMKHMVQVEISIASPDENKIRQIELYTPSVKKRLVTIERLSSEGIFIRVMAMPFYGDKAELQQLMDLSFNSGAQAFKHKELNYFRWDDVVKTSYDDLLNEKLKRTGTKKDSYDPAFIIKSGEYLLQNNQVQLISVEMPKPKVRGKQTQDWSVVSKMNDRLVLQDTPVIDCGYSQLNNVNWAYIK